AADQLLMSGNAQALTLHVEHGVLDGRAGLLPRAARGLAALRLHEGDVSLPRARILSDDGGSEAIDDGGEASASERLVVLGPADQARVGGELEEVEVAR